jgi:hypothetical protein
MPLSQDLFDSLIPPGVWLNILPLATPEHDTVTVSLRLREEGRRSITVNHDVSRYCPTEQLVFAAAKALEHLARAQEVITRDLLSEVLHRYLAEYVDPF